MFFIDGQVSAARVNAWWLMDQHPPGALNQHVRLHDTSFNASPSSVNTSTGKSCVCGCALDLAPTAASGHTHPRRPWSWVLTFTSSFSLHSFGKGSRIGLDACLDDEPADVTRLGDSSTSSVPIIIRGGRGSAHDGFTTNTITPGGATEPPVNNVSSRGNYQTLPTSAKGEDCALPATGHDANPVGPYTQLGLATNRHGGQAGATGAVGLYDNVHNTLHGGAATLQTGEAQHLTGLYDVTPAKIAMQHSAHDDQTADPSSMYDVYREPKTKQHAAKQRQSRDPNGLYDVYRAPDTQGSSQEPVYLQPTPRVEADTTHVLSALVVNPETPYKLATKAVTAQYGNAQDPHHAKRPRSANDVAAAAGAFDGSDANDSMRTTSFGSTSVATRPPEPFAATRPSVSVVAVTQF